MQGLRQEQQQLGVESAYRAVVPAASKSACSASEGQRSWTCTFPPSASGEFEVLDERLEATFPSQLLKVATVHGKE